MTTSSSRETISRVRLVTTALDLVTRFGWCQGSEAILCDGTPTGALDPHAVAWDLTGALQRAMTWSDFGVYATTMAALENKLGDLGEWNDDPERIKRDVIDALSEVL